MAAHLLEFFKKSVNRPKSLQIWSARLVMAKSVAKCCSQYFPLDVPDLSLPLCKVLMCTPLIMTWTYLSFEGSTSSRPICEGDGQPERGLPPPDVRVPAKRAGKGETCCLVLQQIDMEFILVTLYTTIPFPLAVSESANSDVQRFASE